MLYKYMNNQKELKLNSLHFINRVVAPNKKNLLILFLNDCKNLIPKLSSYFIIFIPRPYTKDVRVVSRSGVVVMNF